MIPRKSRIRIHYSYFYLGGNHDFFHFSLKISIVYLLKFANRNYPVRNSSNDSALSCIADGPGFDPRRRRLRFWTPKICSNGELAILITMVCSLITVVMSKLLLITVHRESCIGSKMEKPAPGLWHVSARFGLPCADFHCPGGLCYRNSCITLLIPNLHPFIPKLLRLCNDVESNPGPPGSGTSPRKPRGSSKRRGPPAGFER